MKYIIKLIFIFVCIAHTALYPMNILIVGNGGREHALAWKIAQSPQVNRIFVAPGNGGTAEQEPKTQNIPIAATNIDALITFAQQHSIDLTIVGPEVPLVLGIVDQFTKHGLACFGPTQAAARIESSKVFAKDFMKRHHIPTADYASFSNAQQARDYINNHTPPFVIKADGLAAGKGVFIAQNKQEAFNVISEILEQNNFGAAWHY